MQDIMNRNGTRNGASGGLPALPQAWLASALCAGVGGGQGPTGGEDFRDRLAQAETAQDLRPQRRIGALAALIGRLRPLSAQARRTA